MEYKLNQLVVYAGHGVASVKRIEQRPIGGVIKEFYVLNVLASQMSIIVPVGTASDHIRPIASKAFARSVMDFLDNGKVKQLDDSTWNRRYREFMELLKTGALMDIATVYKQLLTIRSDKDLSFGERKMLDHSKTLLVQELSIALESKEDEIFSILTDVSA